MNGGDGLDTILGFAATAQSTTAPGLTAIARVSATMWSKGGAGNDFMYGEGFWALFATPASKEQARKAA